MATSTLNTSAPSPLASTVSPAVSSVEPSDPAYLSADEPQRRVLLLATSRTEGRSTAALAQVAAEAEAQRAEVTRVDLRGYPLVFPDQDVAKFPREVRDLIEVGKAADVIVIGMPVIRSAIAGFTRHWIEILREGVKGTVVVPIVAAGSARSTLVGNDVRADLLLNFESRPTAAIVISPDLDDTELATRIADLMLTALSEAVVR